MSKQLSAADNHIIQINNGRWRLVVNERPTAEASHVGLRYGGKFARVRRLPVEGLLSVTQMQQVILGWQQSDEAWHLGIVLKREMAEQRGSRWVELARWPDPDLFVFEETATDAGEALAEILGLPFHSVEPHPLAKPAAKSPLPEPPFTFGVWQMRHTEQGKTGYIIQRLPRWRRMKYGRVLWYGVWATIYFVLSMATLNSAIALPNAGTLLPSPQLLPYMGIGIAGFLILLMIWQLLQIAWRPNRVIIDPAAGQISAWTNKRLRWVVDTIEVHSIYVSEVVKRRERGPATEHGELNLHLGGGKFRFLLQQHEPQPDSSIAPAAPVPRSDKDGLAALERNSLTTDLQAAGLTIAEALDNVAAWHDLRVK